MRKKTRIGFAAVSAALLLLAAASFVFAESEREGGTLIDTILTAGTTQAFTEEAVADEDLETILRAGMAAESAINQQPWFFVAVKDKAVMEEISASGGGFKMPEGFNKNGEAPKDAPAGMPAGDKPAGEAPAGMPAMPAGGSAKASLGDTPVAILVYKNGSTSSPDASFDCGLAVQNMYLAASSLGYGVKIVSSPTMRLNGEDHDALCGKLGVDPSYEALAVLLIGKAETETDLVTSATVRADFAEKISIIG